MAGPLGPALVRRTLLLNGALGILFGALRGRRGLGAAILARMSAHLPLQPAPALVS